MVLFRFVNTAIFKLLQQVLSYDLPVRSGLFSTFTFNFKTLNLMLNHFIVRGPYDLFFWSVLRLLRAFQSLAFRTWTRVCLGIAVTSGSKALSGATVYMMLMLAPPLSNG
jgi:hypothetical protein